MTGTTTTSATTAYRLAYAMLAAWSHAGHHGTEAMPRDPFHVLAALDARILETAGHGRAARMRKASTELATAIVEHEGTSKLEAAIEDAARDKRGADYLRMAAGTFPLSELLEDVGHLIASYVEHDDDATGLQVERDAFAAMTPAQWREAQARAVVQADAEANGHELAELAITYLRTAGLPEHVAADAEREQERRYLEAMTGEDVSTLEAVQVVAWCREWAADCDWQDADAEEVYAMTGLGILTGSARRLDGGLATALEDVRRLAAAEATGHSVRVPAITGEEHGAFDASTGEAAKPVATPLDVSCLEGLSALVLDLREVMAGEGSADGREHAAKLLATLRAWLGLLPSSVLQDVPAATLELAGMTLERDGSSYRSGQPGAVERYKLVDVEPVEPDTSAGDPAKRILPDYAAADGSGALVMLPGTMLPNGAVVMAASAAHAHRWIVLAMRPGFHASGAYVTWTASRPGDGQDTTNGHYLDSIEEATADYLERCQRGY